MCTLCMLGMNNPRVFDLYLVTTCVLLFSSFNTDEHHNMRCANSYYGIQYLLSLYYY